MVKRYLEVDLIRGFALVLMIVFHLFYDLNHFNYIDINIRSGIECHYFRFFILTLFIGTVGISLTLANTNGLKLKAIKIRTLKLLLAATLITITTLFSNPAMWIYFGVIHFILLASLVGLLFVGRPLLSLILGVTILVLFNLDLISTHWLYLQLRELLHLPKYTEDLVRFVPWFGVVLIGIFIGHKKYFDFNTQENRLTKPLTFLGKHALVIYLVHQPILFGFFELLKKV